MKRTAGCALTCVSLVLASLAWGQATREFNWVPSGKIAVGDDRSEAAGRYWSDATALVRTDLPYASGRKALATGRQVKLESFRVKIATYRGGPAPAGLVIRRRWDTSLPAATLKIKVEDKDLAPWAIPAFQGNRRRVDVFYAVPVQALKTPDGKGMKAEVGVSVASEAPILSSEYAFFITRDWEILGDGLLGPIGRKEGGDPKLAYLSGIAALGETDYDAALKSFEKAGADPASELARLARRMARLVRTRQAADALAASPTPGPANKDAAPSKADLFRAHYLLGIYASANGFWEEALDAFQKALSFDPAHADATYRLAEAMESNRMPEEICAPVFERSGMLANRKDTCIEDVLVAINTRAVKDMCAELLLPSLEAIFRDWRIVEQMTYGASRGAWKMRTTYLISGPGSPDWVMQAGWIFSPPDSEVPIRGTYDYSINTAEYGSSHAGGVDCGVNGAAGAQIGATRGWEVFLHEWNHEFDWVCVCAEQVPGYPVTHDSDGCGKQPIVNMGCGHRSSMRYYINPAQYRRHQGSDPELPGNHIRLWSASELAALTVPGDLEAWIVENNWMTKDEMAGLKREWDAEHKKDPAKTPEWKERLHERWNRVKMIDKVASPKEADLVANPSAVRWQRFESKTDFVDLLKVFPRAPEKCVAYVTTYVWSPKKQETRLWLGYNVCSAVWLNGRLIHRGTYYECARWEDQARTDQLANSAHLEAGWNRLVAKVERGGKGWGFSVGLTTFDNRPVEGLKYQNSAPSRLVPLYEPPKAGVHYKWDDVKEDYIELLPTLSEKDLQAITGIAGLRTRENIFYLEVGAAPAGARVIPDPLPDPKATVKNDVHQLNNFLNWDTEAVAAIRYQKDGRPRDLLLIRPEYFDDYLELLKEQDAGLPGSGPKDRILGILRIKNPAYASTANREGSRYVLAVETSLGDYPLDEEDLLAIKR